MAEEEKKDQSAAGKQSETPEGDVVETIDATLKPGESPSDLQRPLAENYNPERVRDLHRSIITYWLLAIFSLLVVFAFCALYLVEGKPSFEELKAMLELLLGPVVALVSAATGFYFGANSAGKGPR